MAHMGLVLRVWLILLAVLVPAAAEQPVLIGVLSFRPIAQTLQQWTPTAEYLSRSIPGHVFQVVPMNYPDLDRAVKEGRFDFVFTNPEHFVLLRNQTSLAPILTIMPLANGHPVTSFGGVVVTRSSRKDINRLEDLAGKSVAAPSEESLGGNLMQLWELYRRGIAFPRISYLGMPHDLSVQAVMGGTADAAFVRTGVLEGMVREGKLKAAEFKVINAQPEGDFPQVLSTALYPEWPFCSTRKTPEELVKSVSLALLSIEHGDPVAKAGGYFGFSPPGDYSTVEAVMLRLRVHPGRLAQFDLLDVVYKYATALIASLIILVMFMAAVAVYLIIGNRAARKLLKQRDAAQSALRDSIHQLERTNLELENFAYVAAHDLQTPLRNIVSFNQLLAKRYKGRLDSDADDFIAFVVDNAKKMSDLISDLLRYSRVSRKFEPLARVDAAAAARQALANLRTDIAEAAAEVMVGDLPVVMAEESLLISLFQNLLGNALKYCTPGIHPRIGITAAKNEEGKWLIGVADNGIGIDPQYQEKIFEIFQRLDPTAGAGGTGVGLTICRRIVNHFGGRIWVESAPGQGATFFFTLRDASVQS